MIGHIVQYTLYGLLFLSAMLAVAGLYLVFHVRRGKALDGEMSAVLSGLSLLAGVSPYVGLFGTVWHIIQALGGIGGGNLNVAAIAQPIGLALFATLWGLGSAILALVAHRIILVLLATHEDADAGSAANTQEF
ncbi:MotA/TolQ/ExbB proton channel family protein [Burkholderia multivorans]|jgi:biopolymer transport protein ExbB/TolQ|uniref:MotA/TolQ/ExbB proton channel family protein n=1 Tax=Burkholderia multivorans TaxID=87883 RepID=UPI001C2311BC|nr:MotA/TolQ/ExbB proton channel family protein [Burkholderia multivorans]MBU9199784.1 MotA/TolQ/ExbB proton channel family protein [Burkholderia multivorans]MDN8079097.1 MotA/TolQ/ExbB proton channel family protein [Burkholderia multivorans]